MRSRSRCCDRRTIFGTDPTVRICTWFRLIILILRTPWPSKHSTNHCPPARPSPTSTCCHTVNWLSPQNSRRMLWKRNRNSWRRWMRRWLTPRKYSTGKNISRIKIARKNPKALQPWNKWPSTSLKDVGKCRRWQIMRWKRSRISLHNWKSWRRKWPKNAT